MVALYRPEEKGVDGVTKRAHKTPVDLLGPMLRILIRWLPERRFVGCADGNAAAHEPAEVAAAAPGRLTFVSKFHPEANLCDPPPPVRGKRPAHRPRKEGKELPKPARAVQGTPKPPVLDVAWYGGGRRRVEVVGGVGLLPPAGDREVEGRARPIQPGGGEPVDGGERRGRAVDLADAPAPHGVPVRGRPAVRGR
jgi:hypothetical protein